MGALWTAAGGRRELYDGISAIEGVRLRRYGPSSLCASPSHRAPALEPGCSALPRSAADKAGGHAAARTSWPHAAGSSPTSTRKPAGSPKKTLGRSPARHGYGANNSRHAAKAEAVTGARPPRCRALRRSSMAESEKSRRAAARACGVWNSSTSASVASGPQWGTIRSMRPKVSMTREWQDFRVRSAKSRYGTPSAGPRSESAACKPASMATVWVVERVCITWKPEMSCVCAAVVDSVDIGRERDTKRCPKPFGAAPPAFPSAPDAATPNKRPEPSTR
mmetsp:Transcript_5539/g.15198  ORF Transcript_5539/g.15198 Transcript_5539/m.15198 type:complete len:278 (+) Transcript_5539:70-903(+)